MIPRSLSLALSVVLLWPIVLRAQVKPEFREPLLVDVFNPNVGDSPDRDKMYEDIEILRRILDRKLQPLYERVHYSTTNPAYFGQLPINSTGGSPYAVVNPSVPFSNPYPPMQANQTWAQPYNSTNYLLAKQLYGQLFSNAEPTLTTKEVGFSSLEGVYLKGQGIVYTATLTSLQPQAKTESAKKAVSEWESVRRQVRNEKEKPNKPEASKTPSLSDVLLKVLAENGHNFSQLGENESLTIIITVHDANAPSPPAKSGEGSAKTESKPSNSDHSNPQSQVRDLELLGELHLKQGKTEEAIKALHKALELTESSKGKAELHRKLAQCYLIQGQDEKARTAVDQAIAYLKKQSEAKRKPAPSPKPPALPVKLIVSAPKKLLDQAKEGKITFEEFRRQAHVETLRFDDRR